MLGEFSPQQIEPLVKRSGTFVHPSTWIKNLCEVLGQKKGLELHVVSQTTELKENQTVIYQGVTFHFVKRPSRLRAATLFQFDRLRIMRVLKKIQPDLVHAQGTDEYGYAAMSGPWPAVLTLHGIRRMEAQWLSTSFFSRWTLLKYIEAYCIRKAKHIISINPYVERLIRHETRAIIHPIENPIHDDFFNMQSSRDITRFVFVGTLDPRKSPLMLMRAFLRARKKFANIRLTVIGPYDEHYPEYRREVEQFVEQLSGKDGIELLGWCQPEKVRREIVKAGILVLPSKQETAPMVIAEAMAAGLAIIATRAGGVEHMVRQDEEGYLLEVDDEAGLYAALLQTQQNKEKTIAMGKAAQVSAKKRFSASVIAEKIYQVYQTIHQEQQS